MPVFFIFSGSSSYDSVRSLSYAEADVFLVCYKISDPSTLYNVKNKWMPEIRRHRSNVPVILCGCQSDLRCDPEVIANLSKRGRAPVSPEQALAICCDVGAANYVETSALTCEVIEAFEVAALAFMKTPFRTNSSHNSNSSSIKTRLNLSCETSEFSAHQIAQPQQNTSCELEDFFNPNSPMMSRRQRQTSHPQRASFSAKTESSPIGLKKANLLRKTSFRSPPPQAPPIQHPPPPQNHETKAKAYESLKSHGSTGSTGSSKNSTSSSSVLLDLDENVPNTEDPELLNQLSFVSPKAGVYRPVNPPANLAKIKDKDKCIVM